MYTEYEDEEWAPIQGYPNYEISSFGRVYNIRHARFKKARIHDGYKVILLYNNGFSKSFSVHRLVATAFIPNIWDAPEVNHIDGNKRNNHVDNLEWVTTSKNHYHAYRIGLRNKPNSPVKIIETGEVFESQLACAEAIGGDQGSISSCLSGKRKTHRGFTFEHVDLDRRG